MKKNLLFSITLSFLSFMGYSQCPKPYQISSNKKTTNSITLTWNSGDNSLTGDFEIEYGLKNFSLGTGTKVSSTIIGVQINNLKSNTQYDFYVTNKCGNTPSTSNVYKNYTIANYCNGDQFLDPGSEKNYSGVHNTSYTLSPNSSNKRISLEFESFHLSSHATLTIWEGNFPYGDPVAIFDDNSPPTKPIISKSKNGDFYVKFISSNIQNNAPGWVGKIDCIDKPQCNSPKYITPSNITENSVTLRWWKSTSNRTFIEYGPKNFDLGKGTTVDTFLNEITISSLNELTEYDFYLTEECEDNIYSDTERIAPITTKSVCDKNIFFRKINSYWINQVEIIGVNIESNEECQLEYGLKGFTLGQGTTKNYSSKDIVLQDLESGTEYDFYLRRKCGKILGAPIGPYSQTTNIDYCNEGKLFDRGGKDRIYTNYQKTRDRYIHIGNNNRARIKVNWIHLESYQQIKIYDGPDSNSPLLKHLRRSLSSNYKEFISSGNSDVIFFDIIGASYYSDNIKWDIDITCELTPNCEEVTDFKVNDSKLTHNQCELNWTKTSNLNDSYTIEYGLEGFEKGTGTIVQTNEDSITLEKLNKSSLYQAYITTNCGLGGQDNVYVTPITFKTTPNYFEGDKFTDDGGTENNIPKNQTKITTIYPKNMGERIRITFDYIDLLSRYSSSSLKLYNGTDTDSELIVVLKNTNDLKSKGSLFFSTNSNGAITVEFIGDEWYSNDYSTGWVASIISQPIPDCSEPFNISTTRFTHEEINLIWDSEEDVTEWSIEYGPTGFIRGNGLTKETKTKNITITGLSPVTEYDFYISSKCDSGNFNNYASVYSEKTRQDFTSGAILTSNDEVRKIYPDNIGERIRVEFINFDVNPDTGYTSALFHHRTIYLMFNILDENYYNRSNSYAFHYYSSPYSVISEKDDGSILYDQSLDDTSHWKAKIYSEAKPTCQIINEKHLLFQRVSDREVELIWEKTDDNIEYEIEYGPVGFSLGTGNTKEFNSNRQFSWPNLHRPGYNYYTEKKSTYKDNIIYYSSIIDNLEENTEYEFYITTKCADGFEDTYPIPKKTKTARNLLNEGIYHAYSSGQLKDGQFENTTIYPNSTNERIVATIKRLRIWGKYYYGDPLIIFNDNNSKDSNKILYSNFYRKEYYHDDVVIKSDNENGCLTFNYSLPTSHSFVYQLETLKKYDFSSFTYKGWIIEISSEPKENKLNIENFDSDTDIQLYPIPSKDYFFIKSKLNLEIKEIKITDITGRIVKKYFNTKVNQKHYFDLPNGVYYVIIKTENRDRIIKKIIVQ